MRETPRSLGAYYILCGLMGLLGGGFSVLACTHMPVGGLMIFMLVTGGLYTLVSAVDLWIGANLARLLVERPHIPLRFAVAGLILSGIRFNILGLAVGLYIYYQLKRLAREADVKQEQRVLE